jgi:HK97 family phage major capsid protein
MTDNSPTLAQPTITAARWDAFVPYSWELGQDDPNLTGELVRLIADGRDQLESTKFYSGGGTNEPRGVMSGLSATQRVATAGATAFAIGDVYSLKQAVPARWAETTTFVAHPKTFDTAYRFVGGNSTEPEIFDTGRGGPILGRPKAEWSSVGTQWTTTSGTIAIAGDLRAGFMVVDRLGLTAVPVPVLFSGNTAGGFGYPNGMSGLAVWGRTGADVINANALRALVVS